MAKGETARGQIASFSPFRCRMWDFHDRHQEQVTEESCRAEIESFRKQGQLVPVLGRLIDDSGYDVELIYGARRLFVARHLNVPLRVETRSISDREAIVAMDAENRHRKDISPYERGLSYLKWMREGFFKSQEDIAKELNVSASQVSRLIKAARLPAVIIEAFGNPTEICEAWAVELTAALEDSSRRDFIIRKAREISARDSRPSAREVCRMLLAASDAGRKPAARNRDLVVTGHGGAPLFRIRHTRTAVLIMLPTQAVSTKVLADVSGSIQVLLQKPKSAGTGAGKVGFPESLVQTETI